jgi:hypothetical protein
MKGAENNKRHKESQDLPTTNTQTLAHSTSCLNYQTYKP